MTPPRCRGWLLRALVWFLGIAAPVVGPCIGAAGESTRPAWVLATYNVGNYTLADRRVEGVFRRAYPKPETEKAALRSVVARLDADVLILQELGGEAFLTELRRDLRSEGVSYPHGGSVDGADTDRRIAWLSRRPPVRVVAHTDLVTIHAGRTEPVRRGLLELEFRWDGPTGVLTLFGVHLKSRVTREVEDPGAASQRLREAEAIRRRILERIRDLDGRAVVVLGDFNDTRTDPVLARFREQGSRRLFALVEAADPRGDRWTHRFDREDTYGRADYALVSTLLDRGPVTVRGGILDGADVATASDHRPVWLTLGW